MQWCFNWEIGAALLCNLCWVPGWTTNRPRASTSSGNVNWCRCGPPWTFTLHVENLVGESNHFLWVVTAFWDMSKFFSCFGEPRCDVCPAGQLMLFWLSICADFIPVVVAFFMKAKQCATTSDMKIAVLLQMNFPPVHLSIDVLAPQSPFKMDQTLWRNRPCWEVCFFRGNTCSRPRWLVAVGYCPRHEPLWTMHTVHGELEMPSYGHPLSAAQCMAYCLKHEEAQRCGCWA